MGARTQNQLIRYVKLLDCLRAKKSGWTVAQLVENLETSRPTIYRDLKLLHASGLALKVETVTGEKRYRLGTLDATTISLTPDVLTALILARQELSAIEGTKPVRALDRILKSIGTVSRSTAIVSSDNRTPKNQAFVANLETAIQKKRRVTIEYLGASEAEPSLRTIEPVELRTWHKAVYCAAWCLRSSDWRVFKISRIQDITSLTDRSVAHPTFNGDEVFAHSMGIWSGTPLKAKIWIDQSRAKLVSEYPLADPQKVTKRSDGSVVVTGLVAAEEEALQWAFRWGANAEILGPPSLREAMSRQMWAAAGRYSKRNSEISPSDEGK